MLPIVLDAIAIIVLVIYFVKGLKKGLLGFVIGILSLIIGIMGGRFFAETYSDKLSESYFIPYVADKIEVALSSIDIPTDRIILNTSEGINTFSALLSDVLNHSKLPEFSFVNSVFPIIEKTKEISSSYITNVSESIESVTSVIIAKKLSYFTIFIISFLIIQGLAFYLASLVNSFFKLPIIGSVNRLAGGLLSLLFGALTLTMVLWLVSVLIPSSTTSGGLLSAEVLDKTYVAHYLTDAYDKLFEAFRNL